MKNVLPDHRTQKELDLEFELELEFQTLREVQFHSSSTAAQNLADLMQKEDLRQFKLCLDQYLMVFHQEKAKSIFHHSVVLGETNTRAPLLYLALADPKRIDFLNSLLNAHAIEHTIHHPEGFDHAVAPHYSIPVMMAMQYMNFEATERLIEYGSVCVCRDSDLSLEVYFTQFFKHMERLVQMGRMSEWEITARENFEDQMKDFGYRLEMIQKINKGRSPCLSLNGRKTVCLLECIQKNDVQRFRKLLKFYTIYFSKKEIREILDESIICREPSSHRYNWTTGLLHETLLQGNMVFLQELLVCGTDPNQIESQSDGRGSFIGRPVILTALTYKNLTAVAFLLMAKVNLVLNEGQNNQWSAVDEVEGWLRNANCEMPPMDRDCYRKMLLLMWMHRAILAPQGAADLKPFELIRKDEKLKSLWKEDRSLFSLLLFPIIEYGRIELLKTLLEGEVDLSVVHPIEGVTLLQKAFNSQNTHVDLRWMIPLLQQQRRRVNSRDNSLFHCKKWTEIIDSAHRRDFQRLQALLIPFISHIDRFWTVQDKQNLSMTLAFYVQGLESEELNHSHVQTIHFLLVLDANPLERSSVRGGTFWNWILNPDRWNSEYMRGVKELLFKKTTHFIEIDESIGCEEIQRLTHVLDNIPHSNGVASVFQGEAREVFSTFLFKALSYKRLDVILMLLGRGADPYVINPETGVPLNLWCLLKVRDVLMNPQQTNDRQLMWITFLLVYQSHQLKLRQSQNEGVERESFLQIKAKLFNWTPCFTSLCFAILQDDLRAFLNALEALPHENGIGAVFQQEPGIVSLLLRAAIQEEESWDVITPLLENGADPDLLDGIIDGGLSESNPLVSELTPVVSESIPLDCESESNPLVNERIVDRWLNLTEEQPDFMPSFDSMTAEQAQQKVDLKSNENEGDGIWNPLYATLLSSSPPQEGEKDTTSRESKKRKRESG